MADVVKTAWAAVHVALLLVVLIAMGVWFATMTGAVFYQLFALLVVLAALSIVSGYASASSSTVMGFIGQWRSEWLKIFPRQAESDDVLRDARRTRDAFLWIALTGLAAIFIYSLQWQPAGFARILGAAVMIAVASLAGGVCLGFLFGIPRSLQAPHPAAPPATGGATTSSTSTTNTDAATLGVNTNLEQISDWLTKIIVGLGLINLDKLPAKLHKLIDWLAPSVARDSGFTLAIVGGYGVCGFLLGYLLTRLYLMRAFAIADSSPWKKIDPKLATVANDATQRPSAEGAAPEVGEAAAKAAAAPKPTDDESLSGPAVTSKERQVAEKVEELAGEIEPEELRRRFDALASEYENTRKAMPAGDARTRAMEAIAAKMRALGLAGSNLLPVLAASPSPGHRLAAISCLEMKPDENYVQWLGERVNPRVEKPFIGYHAASALGYAAEKLPLSALDDVQAAINKALADLGSEKAHTDRARTLRDALNTLSRRRSVGA